MHAKSNPETRRLVNTYERRTKSPSLTILIKDKEYLRSKFL